MNPQRFFLLTMGFWCILLLIATQATAERAPVDTHQCMTVSELSAFFQIIDAEVVSSISSRSSSNTNAVTIRAGENLHSYTLNHSTNEWCHVTPTDA